MDDIRKKAQEVRAEIYKDCDYPPAVQSNVSKILKAISTLSGFQIATIIVPKEDMPKIKGMILPFPDGNDFAAYCEKHPHLKQHLKFEHNGGSAAIILVSSENNPCWERFTIVKEASHLYFEGSDLISYPVRDLARALTATPSLDEQSEEDRVILERETTGIIAAIELLLPCGTKEWMEHKVNVEKYSSYQVAVHLKLPEKFVLNRMRQWGLA